MINIKIGGNKIAYIDPKKIILIEEIEQSSLGGQKFYSQIFIEGIKQTIYSTEFINDIAERLKNEK
jgi:hypothetical protein